jgi:hypothetical protein
VLVQSVTRDSAADEAGLHPGDRVVAVSGKLCTSHGGRTDISSSALALLASTSMAASPHSRAGVESRPSSEHASSLIRASLQEVKLVVTGASVAVSVRKDADGIRPW